MTQEGFDITERIRGEKTMSKNYKFETLQVHAGQKQDSRRSGSSPETAGGIVMKMAAIQGMASR